MGIFKGTFLPLLYGGACAIPFYLGMSSMMDLYFGDDEASLYSSVFWFMAFAVVTFLVLKFVFPSRSTDPK